jgi:hypothetical protein
VTQSPEDVPARVLAQLGNRVQHALRAFTPNDQAMIEATARTFPMTKLYDVAAELTSLGIGEGLVTVLGPNGVPTPTVHCVMRPPRSLMAQLDPAAFDAIVAASKLVPEYATDVDPQAAKEMLAARMAQAQLGAMSPATLVPGMTAVTATGAPMTDLDRLYAAQAAASMSAYEKAVAEAARADARDEATARRRAHRPVGGYADGSADGTIGWEEAAQMGAQVLSSPAANTLLRGIFGTLGGSPARRRRRR